METIDIVSKVIDIKSVLKCLAEYTASNNKNVRTAAYKIAIFRCSESLDNMKSYIEKGSKDAVVEVRTLCKTALSLLVIENATQIPKKTILISSTPRKNLRIENI